MYIPYPTKLKTIRNISYSFVKEYLYRKGIVSNDTVETMQNISIVTLSVSILIKNSHSDYYNVRDDFVDLVCYKESGKSQFSENKTFVLHVSQFSLVKW